MFSLFKIFFSNKQTPFWLLVFSAMICLSVRLLIREGMFMDALLYSSVSHNLSQNIGSFWFPVFADWNVAGMSSFHEHPPLVFGIQSLFFKLLGDGTYVECIYTFLTMCLTALLIVFLWKDIFRNKAEYRGFGWLPLIFWITTPICFWSYSNNMQENTLGLFTLSSVILTHRAFYSKKFPFLYLFFSSIFIFLASLSKGVPGLFPIAVPFLFWLTSKQFRLSKAFVYTTILILIPVLIYLVLCFFPASQQSLSIYFFKRLLQRVAENPTVDSRFYILGRLFTELLPGLLVVFVFLFAARIKKMTALVSENIRTVFFFLAVGLAASAPLMITLVQKAFYFVPSIPFFAIGFSLLVVPLVSSLLNKSAFVEKKFRGLLFLSSIIFVGSIIFSFSNANKPDRDRVLLGDVHLIGEVVPNYEAVSVSPELWQNWSLQCYLMRYFNISLEQTISHHFLIMDNMSERNIPPQFVKVNIPTTRYDLFERL